MTVIALAMNEDSIALAADRAWTDEHDNTITYSPKLVVVNDDAGSVVGAIATSGMSCRGQEIEAVVRSIHGELVGDVARRLFAAVGPLPRFERGGDEGRSDFAEAILVLRGRAFMVFDDGAVVEMFDDGAIGCGAGCARGAMWKRRGTARARALHACRAACEIVAYCGGKIDVFEMPRAKAP